MVTMGIMPPLQSNFFVLSLMWESAICTELSITIFFAVEVKSCLQAGDKK
jgi:hypothetical protein